MLKWITGLLVALFLSGCATAPAEIEKTATAPVSVAQVQKDSVSHLGKTVRWGGSILNVANRKDSTTIEVLSRPLSSSSRPLDKPGTGRFMVEIPGFVDPASYPVGRDLTVVGTLIRVDEKSVGEFPYQYPVLASINLHLWPEVVERDLYYPYYYDPFFGPPMFHPWPYYSPAWRHHPYYW